MPRHWLFKSEPDVFGYPDLERSPKKTSCWDGVRNYQARNLLRDEVKKGDWVLFHHSSAKPSGIAGIARVVRAGYPDPTALNPRSSGFDPKSDPDDPRWFAVDVRAVRALPRLLPLAELREVSALSDMLLLRRGQRLSVQPVTPAEWRAVLKLAGVTVSSLRGSS